MGSPKPFALHINWGSWAFPLAIHTDLSPHRDWWAVSIQILPVCLIFSWGPALKESRAA